MRWHGGASGKRGRSPEVQRSGDSVVAVDQKLVQSVAVAGDGHNAKRLAGLGW